MSHRAPILNLLLALLLAVSPAFCFCRPTDARSAPSCCTAAPQEAACACWKDRPGEHGDTARGGEQHPGDPGCNRCQGSCKCKTAPTMKAEMPPTVALATLVAVPMEFGVLSPLRDSVARNLTGWIELRGVPRSETTLLRQHCALTI